MLQIYIDLLVSAITDKGTTTHVQDFHVVSLPSKDPQEGEPSPTAETVERRFKFIERQENVNLRQRLVRIIRRALLWRTEISVGIDTKYRFAWPCFLDPYRRDTHDIQNFDSPEGMEKGISEHQVLLGLLPVVWWQVRKDVGKEEWGLWERVCKGRVLRL